MNRSTFKTIWDWPSVESQSADETIDKAYPRPSDPNFVTDALIIVPETEAQKQERMWEALKDMASGG